MNRLKFLQNTFSAFTLLGVAPSLLTRTKTDSALLMQSGGSIEVLRDQVGIYTQSGGTIGLFLNAGQTVVIDSQYPDNAKKVIELLQEQSFTQNLILCNTHHHGDHTGGNDLFNDLGSRIIAHKAVPELMKKQSESRNRPLATVPTELFDTSFSIKLDNEHLTARHFGPAHTGGDAVYHFENANIAHTGDLIFNGVYPFIDANGGGSIKQWIKVLSDIEQHFDKDTLFIFGHGKQVTGSLAQVREKREYLSSLIEAAQNAHKKGQSTEEFSRDTTVVFERNEMWNGAKAMNMERAWEEVAKSR